MQIHSSSLEKANYSIPWTFEGFLDWAEKNGVVPRSYEDIDRDDFNQCRQFIKDAAESGESASVSY